MERIPGDANGDGEVDVSDLGILAANYGLTAGADWSMGDFNTDGTVDVSDLGILAANYGTGERAAMSGAAKVETRQSGLCGADSLIPIIGIFLCLALVDAMVFSTNR
jgi:uncharacterized protein (DUF2141 family)